MRRWLSATGPAAALIAFKCPVCLMALTGFGAGLGSLFPIIQGIYWIVIGGLGLVFLWFLIRSWNYGHISGWIIGLGGLGLAGLALQALWRIEGVLAVLPGVALVLSSMASFAATRLRESGAVCCAAAGHCATGGKGEEEMARHKRRVEVFTSGCPVCEPVVDLVKKTACPSCDVVVYDLNAGCATNECRDKAKQYGISRVPAVVVDGKLLDCCKIGTVTERELRAAGVGST